MRTVQRLYGQQGGTAPFIVTLSMMNLSRGVAYIITTGSPLSVSGYLPDSFRFLATGDVFGIPVLFLIFLLVTVVALIFTKKSNACRNIYYVAAMKMPPSSPVSM